jgi:hypothetical protein
MLSHRLKNDLLIIVSRQEKKLSSLTRLIAVFLLGGIRRKS